MGEAGKDLRIGDDWLQAALAMFAVWVADRRGELIEPPLPAPLPADAEARYVGAYEFANHAATIAIDDGQLLCTLSADGGQTRLVPFDRDAFVDDEYKKLELTFRVVDGISEAFVVHLGGETVVATRALVSRRVVPRDLAARLIGRYVVDDHSLVIAHEADQLIVEMATLRMPLELVTDGALRAVHVPAFEVHFAANSPVIDSIELRGRGGVSIAKRVSSDQ